MKRLSQLSLDIVDVKVPSKHQESTQHSTGNTSITETKEKSHHGHRRIFPVTLQQWYKVFKQKAMPSLWWSMQMKYWPNVARSQNGREAWISMIFTPNILPHLHTLAHRLVESITYLDVPKSVVTSKPPELCHTLMAHNRIIGVYSPILTWLNTSRIMLIRISNTGRAVTFSRTIIEDRESRNRLWLYKRNATLLRVP